LEEIDHALDDSSQRYFHVYNADEELVGVFSVDDVRRYLYDGALWKIVNASDVMMGNVETLPLDDDLARSYKRSPAWWDCLIGELRQA
jgi:CBS domain-containing protein